MRRETAVDALVIVGSPLGVLALTREELAQALERAREVLPVSEPATAAQGAPERLLDAEQLAQATGVPASWWSDQARQGAIPHFKFGKYPRFSLGEILKCEKFRERER